MLLIPFLVSIFLRMVPLSNNLLFRITVTYLVYRTGSYGWREPTGPFIILGSLAWVSYRESKTLKLFYFQYLLLSWIHGGSGKWDKEDGRAWDRNITSL